MLTITIDKGPGFFQFLADNNRQMELWDNVWITYPQGTETQQEADAIVQALYDSYDYIQDYRLKRHQVLAQECRARIEMGIDSDITGTMYHYPTTELDQHNLMGTTIKSQIGGAGLEPYLFSGRGPDGVWIRAPHTASEIQALGVLVATHVLDHILTLDALRLAVTQANTIEAINAVVWPQ